MRVSRDGQGANEQGGILNERRLQSWLLPSSRSLRNAVAEASLIGGNLLRQIALATLLSGLACSVALAQSVVSPSTGNAPLIAQPPVVNMIDKNFVSLIDGKAHFTVPALALGDVHFTPYSLNGPVFQGPSQGLPAAVADENYGSLQLCNNTTNNVPYGGVFWCTVGAGLEALQTLYGQRRETFVYDPSSNTYSPQQDDGATLTDNVAANGTCTWTMHDGTQIVYAAYKTSGNPLCQSQNIQTVIFPDGRMLTYNYYGALNQTSSSPLISVVSNTGYMLKYNYSGTPAWGAETSVTAINLAFETCSPTALSCALQNSWPTASITFQNGPNTQIFSNTASYTLTIQDGAGRNYMFLLNPNFRVLSYQPPEANSAVYTYALCQANFSTGQPYPLTDCFGYTSWPSYTGVFQPQPLLIDLVQSVQRDGQTWTYSRNFQPGSSTSEWYHAVTDPLGMTASATGNGTPGTELYYGPIDSVTETNGVVTAFGRDVVNHPGKQTLPSGLYKLYTYSRGNVTNVQQTPWTTSDAPVLNVSAQFPATCTNLSVCNKPQWTKDANNNETDYTYHPIWGGLLTRTDPPGPNGVRPGVIRTYVQQNAWYRDGSGTMVQDPNPVWLLSTETTCMTGSMSGSGCANANDAVVTTYDYGPNSGPNNLLLRGKTVTGPTGTLRTCYAHDMQGNKIWETSPNANPASCPAY